MSPPSRCIVPSLITFIITAHPCRAMLSHTSSMSGAELSPHSRGRAPKPFALRMSLLDDISPSNSRAFVSAGMRIFASGDVAGSIDAFDRSEAAVPDGSLTPYLWQRGISYYYADSFREGSEQFRTDVKVNPLDVEEIVWDIACLARLNPNDPFPPENRLALPIGKTDRRKIMSTVYSLFRGDGATEHDLFAVGHSGSTSDEFYSLFYLGLYCEAQGEMGKAASYMRSATKTRYATGLGAGDYMATCARVHCKLRGWT